MTVLWRSYTVFALADDQEPVIVRLAKRTSYEMIGDFLREIAALVLVFAPLDSYISEGRLSPEWMGATLLVSLLLFLLGIALENPIE